MRGQRRLIGDAVSSIEPWIYIAVPTFLVALLILIKRKQEKIHEYIEPQYAETERVAQTPTSKAPSRTSVQAEETPSQTHEKERPHNCPHYLGYLYMKKSPDSTQILNECYGCEKLLQCLYSPNVVEKLYGE